MKCTVGTRPERGPNACYGGSGGGGAVCFTRPTSLMSNDNDLMSMDNAAMS
jgi:hypothetical protein